MVAINLEEYQSIVFHLAGAKTTQTSSPQHYPNNRAPSMVRVLTAWRMQGRRNG